MPLFQSLRSNNAAGSKLKERTTTAESATAFTMKQSKQQHLVSVGTERSTPIRNNPSFERQRKDDGRREEDHEQGDRPPLLEKRYESRAAVATIVKINTINSDYGARAIAEAKQYVSAKNDSRNAAIPIRKDGLLPPPTSARKNVTSSNSSSRRKQHVITPNMVKRRHVNTKNLPLVMKSDSSGGQSVVSEDRSGTTEHTEKWSNCQNNNNNNNSGSSSNSGMFGKKQRLKNWGMGGVHRLDTIESKGTFDSAWEEEVAGSGATAVSIPKNENICVTTDKENNSSVGNDATTKEFVAGNPTAISNLFLDDEEGNKNKVEKLLPITQRVPSGMSCSAFFVSDNSSPPEFSSTKTNQELNEGHRVPEIKQGQQLPNKPQITNEDEAQKPRVLLHTTKSNESLESVAQYIVPLKTDAYPPASEKSSNLKTVMKHALLSSNQESAGVEHHSNVAEVTEDINLIGLSLNKEELEKREERPKDSTQDNTLDNVDMEKNDGGKIISHLSDSLEKKLVMNEQDHDHKREVSVEKSIISVEETKEVTGNGQVFGDTKNMSSKSVTAEKLETEKTEDKGMPFFKEAENLDHTKKEEAPMTAEQNDLGMEKKENGSSESQKMNLLPNLLFTSKEKTNDIEIAKYESKNNRKKRGVLTSILGKRPEVIKEDEEYLVEKKEAMEYHASNIRWTKKNDEASDESMDIHLQMTLSNAEISSVQSSVTGDRILENPTPVVKRSSSIIRNPLQRKNKSKNAEMEELVKCMKNGKLAARADNRRKEEFDKKVPKIVEETINEENMVKKYRHLDEFDDSQNKDYDIQSDSSREINRNDTIMSGCEIIHDDTIITERGVSFVGSLNDSSDIQDMIDTTNLDMKLKPRLSVQTEFGPNKNVSPLAQHILQHVVNGGTITRDAVDAHPFVIKTSSGVERLNSPVSSVDHSTQTSDKSTSAAPIGLFGEVFKSLALFSAQVCIGTGAAMVSCANSCTDSAYNKQRTCNLGSNSFLDEETSQFSPKCDRSKSIFREISVSSPKMAYTQTLAKVISEMPEEEQIDLVRQLSNRSHQVSSKSYERDEVGGDLVSSVDGLFLPSMQGMGSKSKRRVPRNIAVKSKNQKRRDHQQILNNPNELVRVDSAGKTEKKSRGPFKAMIKGLKGMKKTRLAVMYQV